MLFLDAQKVFEAAIAAKVLSKRQWHIMYAGNWMYMHSESDTSHAFKNIVSREYVFLRFAVSE